MTARRDKEGPIHRAVLTWLRVVLPEAVIFHPANESRRPGLAVSWAATWAVLGFSPVQSVGVTAMFFALSTTRQFVLRRLFRRWG